MTQCHGEAEHSHREHNCSRLSVPVNAADISSVFDRVRPGSAFCRSTMMHSVLQEKSHSCVLSVDGRSRRLARARRTNVRTAVPTRSTVNCASKRTGASRASLCTCVLTRATDRTRAPTVAKVSLALLSDCFLACCSLL